VPELESSMPPAHILQRLETYVSDWHESRLPPAMLSAGVYGLKLRRTGNRFRLSLKGGGPVTWAIECRGHVDGSDSSAMSYSIGVRRALWYPLIGEALALTMVFRNELTIMPLVLFWVCGLGGSLAWLQAQSIAARLRPSFDSIMRQVVALETGNVQIG